MQDNPPNKYPQQVPSNNYPQQVPPGVPPQNVQPPRPPKKNRVWLGIVAIVLGVAGFIFIGVGGPETRVLFISIGIALSVAGLVLALIAIVKRWGKGIFIAAAIVTGIALVADIGFLGLGIFANYQSEKIAKQSAEEHQKYLDDKQAALDKILANSAWVDELRDSVVPEDYIDVDEATLANIAADPESYAQKAFEIRTSMGLPMTNPALSEQGLCTVSVQIDAVDATEPSGQKAVIIDRGTDDECPLGDVMLGLNDEEGNLGDSLMAEHRMEVTPFPQAIKADGEDIPAFLLIELVE